MVQFYHWFKFYFLLSLGMVMYDSDFETKENKFWTKNKIEPYDIIQTTCYSYIDYYRVIYTLVHCKLKRIRLQSLTCTFSPMLENPRQSWILDFTPWIPDSRYWIPDYLSVELGFRISNSEFQSTEGFRIP